MSSRLRRPRVLAIAVALALGGALGVGAPAGAAVTSAATAGHAITAVSVSTHAPTSAAATAGMYLFNYNSAQCLGIAGGEDNAPAVQWTCTGNPDQQWHVGGYIDSYWYQIRNGNDNQCLGIAGGNDYQGARVVAWDCQGTSAYNQYWEVVYGPTCNGLQTYVLVNYLSYVVGVAGNSTAVGAPVVMWNWQQVCNNQDWLSVPSGAPVF